MLNQVILVGRLVRDPEVMEFESGKKGSTITLAVNRTYKNLDGEYETDFLDCTLWSPIAESTHEYCKTGDVIGVRGRLQSRVIQKDDGTKYKKVEVIADKVSFLSSSKNKNIIQEEKNEDDDGSCQGNEKAVKKKK